MIDLASADKLEKSETFGVLAIVSNNENPLLSPDRAMLCKIRSPAAGVETENQVQKQHHC